MRAGGFAVAGQGQVELFAMAAHPADLPGRHAHHEREVGDILVDHRAGADEGIAADGGAADDGAIRAQRGALLDQVSRYSFLRSMAARGL